MNSNRKRTKMVHKSRIGQGLTTSRDKWESLFTI